MIHELKILPQFFELVILGIKNYELRKDDRNYQKNDILRLQEWDGREYTGRETVRIVTDKLSSYDGLEPGYCILSIEEVD